MQKTRSQHERGQILLMTTMSLMALIGILALVVDIGWAYFEKKSAQKAADSASIAGITQALANVQNVIPVCGTNVPCQDPTPCPSSISLPTTDPISVACLYAQQNGFTAGGSSGRQNVTVSAGTSLPPPTAPGVTGIYYWMTVRVYQADTLGFGRVMSADASSSRGIATGATQATFSALQRLPLALALSAFVTPAARSSAAISDGMLGGTLFLLNRQNDTWPQDSPGVDLSNSGNPDIVMPGGIYLASTNNGVNNPNSRLRRPSAGKSECDGSIHLYPRCG